MESINKQYSKDKLWVETVLRRYISGTDIESACERLLQQSTTTSKIGNPNSNAERIRVLNNCITLFKNSDVKNQIEKMKASGNFRDNMTLIKHIIQEFYPEIFGLEPQNIAAYILQNYTQGTDLNVLHQRLLHLINNDTSPEHNASNKKCKKILDNCLTLLQDPKIQAEMENIKKSESLTNTSTFVKRILAEYFEEIFEEDKRDYNMPSNYSPNRANLNVIQYRKVINNTANLVPDLDGNMLTIVKVGRLAYKAPLHSADFVDKYQIYTDAGKLICEVFTKLNESALLSNEDYRRAVFKELFSLKNLKACLPSGYIGEIKSTSEILGENMEIGEQKDVFDGYDNFSIYTHSKKFAFIYDYDASDSVKLLLKQQHHSAGTNPNNGDCR